MKIHFAIAAALAASQFVAGAAHGEPLVHEPRVEPNAVADADTIKGMTECPVSLMESPKLFEQQQRSLRAVQDGDQVLNIAVLQVPGSNAQCAALVQPEQRALSPMEFAALNARLARATTPLVNESNVDATGSATTAAAKAGYCNVHVPNVNVYAGTCGTPNAAYLGKAFFVGSNLAMTSGAVVPEGADVCLAAGYAPVTYFDVHAVRRTGGSGESQVVGLSLMRPVGSTGGIYAKNGQLSTPEGSGLGMQVDSDGQCQSGTTFYYDDTFAKFTGPTTSEPTVPVLFAAGGPTTVTDYSTALPIGIQVGNDLTQWRPYNTILYTTVYPKFRRFNGSDINTYTQWAPTAAPPTSKAISITGVNQGQLVDSNQPVNFAVSSSAPYTVTIDGKPAVSPLTVADGDHMLVAYNNAEPKYRHTLTFRAVKATINPDAYEPDNTRETFKTLFEGSPHAGNFHNASDVDWTAYAVPANVKSTVTLAGTVANNASLKLYRQLNYPTGSIDLIATKINTKNQLVLTDTSGNDAQTVYYVEAKPTSASGSGPNSTYTISVVSELQADAYEYDDTRNAFKTLFEDQPHAGNFNKALDSDWTAYSVGPGTRSAVTLTGAAAQNASLTLYRQLNYPNGSIDPVTTSANQANQLVVADTSGADTMTVYYVEARSTSSAASFKPATYSINVSTELLPDSYEADDSREQYHALYAGSPQTHNFHNVTDQDWTAYAVGPSYHSRVDLTGQVAAASRIDLYRQDDYPNGPIVLVASNAEQAGTLTVEDTTPANVAFSVYWVRAMPSNGNTLATKANYVISVQ